MLSATRLKFTIGDVEYQWVGGFGAQFHSHERGVREGDVRMIADKMFYVFSVYHRSWRRIPEVAWGMYGKVEIEDINKLKAEIFA
jgi:hypothetical protein